MATISKNSVNVEAINREERIGLLDTGEIFRFESLYDEFGDPTEELDELGFAVAQLEDGGWIYISFAEYTNVEVN